MLKFYQNERIQFNEAFEKHLDYKEVQIVFKKICRHYKVNPYLIFGRGSNANSYRVQLSNRWGLNFGVLCHEIAHVVSYKKGIKRGHNKKMWRVMASIINYCKKKNWWEEELMKMTEIKIKPEPTIDELRLAKIDKRKNDLIKYDKRLNYFTKLYTNKMKKARRSLAMLQRFV